MESILANAARSAARNAERLRRAWRHSGVRICALTGAVLCAVGLAVACGDRLSDSCSELRTCAMQDAGAVADGDAAQLQDEADAPSDAGKDVAIDRFVCDLSKDPKDEPCVLDDALGVFVASPPAADAGTDGGTTMVSGDGSHLRPYPTIGQALANLGGKTRIYVCNGVYAEQVSITTSVSIYGGLACPTGAAGPVWSYAGAVAQVNSPLPAYAVSVTGVTAVVTIEDMSFASPTATAAGASSIAALVTASSVRLVRVSLTAGSGADGIAGADGTATPNYTGLAPSGGAQVYTDNSGIVMRVSGGPGGVNSCSHRGTSTGGNGGLGCMSMGLGQAGTSAPPAPATVAGYDGLARGAPAPGGGTASGNDPGADGAPGNGGVAPSAFGVLSSTGWAPSAGGDGAPGNPGQGGAGASDPLYGSCGAPLQSVGGGGGGAGGCGGAGGKGGTCGGASIALGSVGSMVDLTECTLTAAAAGAGGAGGAGQDGQAGAPGGDTQLPPDVSNVVHASGAAGGSGAGGSGGAGGTGGISVGILYQGSTITSDMPTNQAIRLGPPGAGGAAGAAGKHSTSGVLTTGVDGNAGAIGGAGTSVAFLKLM